MVTISLKATRKITSTNGTEICHMSRRKSSKKCVRIIIQQGNFEKTSTVIHLILQKLFLKQRKVGKKGRSRTASQWKEWN